VSAFTVVLAPIEFDDEAQFQARKICIVRTDRMLAAKAKAHEPARAELVPESVFWVRLLAAQVAGE
jgi:hypothetical protein